jgi:hypothetical protein
MQYNPLSRRGWERKPGATTSPQLSEMETDEERCIVGVKRVSIVWHRVHKLFTSDCVLAQTAAALYTGYNTRNVS